MDLTWYAHAIPNPNLGLAYAISLAQLCEFDKLDNWFLIDQHHSLGMLIPTIRKVGWLHKLALEHKF